MVDQEVLILMLEDYEKSFHVRLVDMNGKVYSSNYFYGYVDIVNVRNLIGALPSVFGIYQRVIYRSEFKTIWDYKIDPQMFEPFVEQLFASQYHSDLYESSDFKYHSWEQFSEYLEDNYTLTMKSKQEISDDELPF